MRKGASICFKSLTISINKRGGGPQYEKQEISLVSIALKMLENIICRSVSIVREGNQPGFQPRQRCINHIRTQATLETGHTFHRPVIFISDLKAALNLFGCATCW